MIRRKIKPIDDLPKELARCAPRPVALTVSGIGIYVAIAGLVVGAILAGALLNWSLSRDGEIVGVTQAHVLAVRRSDDRVAVNYSYNIDGREYRGRTRVRKRDASKFAPRATVSVQYVAARPEDSWLQGYGRRPVPFWVVGVVPALLLLCTVPLTIVLRRQSTLLRDGRVALARVTKTQKRNHGEHTSCRIEYEWKLLSGAIRSGRHDSGRNPPPVGALIPIVYDRENPGRHAPYPMSLVKVGR
jgi:hypothetical protein